MLRAQGALCCSLLCIAGSSFWTPAGEILLVSMAHVLKTEFNLVLDSSWPLHPALVVEDCKLFAEQALNKAAPAVAALLFSQDG